MYSLHAESDDFAIFRQDFRAHEGFQVVADLDFHRTFQRAVADLGADLQFLRPFQLGFRVFFRVGAFFRSTSICSRRRGAADKSLAAWFITCLA